VKPRRQPPLRPAPALKRFAQSIGIYPQPLAYRVERKQIHVAVQCYPFGGSMSFLLPSPSSRVDGATAETIESIR
jgi:hypothetical protein